LTYAELRLILEGYAERRNREFKERRSLAAWIASIVIAPHVKDPISPAALLGEKEKGRKVLTKAQEVDKALDVAFKHYVRKNGE
jgi:hypothetical protein